MASISKRHVSDRTCSRNIDSVEPQPQQTTPIAESSTDEPLRRDDSPPKPPQTGGKGLIPPAIWNQYHPWPPIGGLRHLIFHAQSNGFNKVVRRVGRSVLIDEEAFFTWVDQQGGTK